MRNRPGEQGPSAGLTLPVVVDPTGDERGDGEGERQGEADQTEVEEGRVEGVERVVLKEDVGTEPAGRDGPGHVVERVGRAEHEPEEEGGHHVDDEGGPGHQGIAGPMAEPPDHRRGVAGQDDGPEQDGPGQGRPQAGDRVEQRGVGAVVVGHEGEREVVGEEGALHGRYGEQPAEQDEGGVDLAPSDRRRPAPGQPGGQHADTHQRGCEPEEDPGVAEGPVHRSGPAVPVSDRAIIASSRPGR